MPSKSTDDFGMFALHYPMLFVQLFCACQLCHFRAEPLPCSCDSAVFELTLLRASQVFAPNIAVTVVREGHIWLRGPKWSVNGVQAQGCSWTLRIHQLDTDISPLFLPVFRPYSIVHRYYQYDIMCLLPSWCVFMMCAQSIICVCFHSHHWQ